MNEVVANAANYDSLLACTDNGQAVAPGANNALVVAKDHVVVCTFTNTRKSGSIELKKVWVGQPGSAQLKVGSSAGGSDVADKTVAANGTTDPKTVDTGTYYVNEVVANAAN